MAPAPEVEQVLDRLCDPEFAQANRPQTSDDRPNLGLQLGCRESNRANQFLNIGVRRLGGEAVYRSGVAEPVECRAAQILEFDERDDCRTVACCPGAKKWGPNQCEIDADKSVDADERLVLKDVTPGKYDVRLKQKSGLTCIVKNVEIKPSRPYAFSIEETELKNCSK
jgi:hypothetical protein